MQRKHEDRVDLRDVSVGLNDFPDARGRIGGVVPGKVIEDAVEVLPEFRSQLDSRHSQRASFLAAGRTAALPAIRSSRKPRIFFHGIVLPEAAMFA